MCFLFQLNKCYFTRNWFLYVLTEAYLATYNYLEFFVQTYTIHLPPDTRMHGFNVGHNLVGFFS